MKIILSLFLILFVMSAFAQDSKFDTVKKYHAVHAPTIAANDAYKYIGQKVIVTDSLYSYKILNDTTIACEMGEQEKTPRLTLLYTGVIEKRADSRFFNTFKRYKITIYGIISGTKKAPILVLRGTNNMTIEDWHVHKNN